MNTWIGGVEVCDGTSRRDAAIDQLQGDGKGAGGGLQLMLNQDGGI